MGPAPRLSAQAAASKVRGRPWRGHRRLLVAWRPGITSGNFQCKGLEKCYEIWGIIYIYISWLWLSHESWLREQQTCHKISWNLYSMRFPQLNCQMRQTRISSTQVLAIVESNFTALGRIFWHRFVTCAGSLRYKHPSHAWRGPCDPVPWCSENWTVFWR